MGLRSLTQLKQRQGHSLSLSQAMTTSLSLLALTGERLDAGLRTLVAANPYLRLRSQHPVDPCGQSIAARGPSLHEIVGRRLANASISGTDAIVALQLLEALEPTGWLVEPLEAIATRSGHEVRRIEAVLVRLQGIAPAGIFARSLSECLRLQLVRRGALTWEVDTLLDNLSLIAEGRTAALAELCDCDPDDLPLLLDQIRSLDPKPGLQFDLVPPPPAPCDLVVRPGVGGWQVTVNELASPSVTVEAGVEADAALVAQAQSVVDGLALRDATTQRAALVLVTIQSDFVSDPAAPRKIARLSDVAARLSLHVSTVSRAIQGRTLDAPRGLIKLKSLLCRSAPGRSAPGRSRDDALEQVRGLIAVEPRDRPLSDAEIARRLARRGFGLARRTVAKYRNALGIASAAARAGNRAGSKAVVRN